MDAGNARSLLRLAEGRGTMAGAHQQTSASALTAHDAALTSAPDVPGPAGRVLYISYDGMLEPLGQSQVLPYLRGLSSQGFCISLLSFEKRADWLMAARGRDLQAELASHRIRWTALPYRRFSPASVSGLVNLLAGIVRAAAMARRDRVNIVHARSYVAGLIAWSLKRLWGLPFLFDMRGFWVEERVDGRLWPSRGLRYRCGKWLERRLLAHAEEVVTLTEAARETVERWPDRRAARVSVIRTCVDLDRFVAPMRRRSPGDAPVFIYAGSLGTWYALRAMLEFFQAAVGRFPLARLALLTRQEREVARELARVPRALQSAITVASASPQEVPRWLAQADVGLAFYQPGWARRATCPTKLGEYLAMGMPVVVNEAIGDVRELIGANRVGAIVTTLSSGAYQRAIDALGALLEDSALAARCRRVAATCFSLSTGVEAYGTIYRRLLSGAARSRHGRADEDRE